MDIQYLGHSSFRIKGRSGSLITDPYDSKMVGLKFPKISADIVTVSHNHEDHNNSSAVEDTKKIITGPGEYEISDISVVGIPSFHDDKKGQERGRNTMYLLEVDGVKIVHLGDIGHKLSDEVVEDLGTIDILMVPVGGVYTVGPTEAAEIVRSIEPLITIPMHYKQEGLNPQNFGQLAPVAEFLKEVALQVENADKLSVKKAELGEEKKVVVLEKK